MPVLFSSGQALLAQRFVGIDRCLRLLERGFGLGQGAGAGAFVERAEHVAGLHRLALGYVHGGDHALRLGSDGRGRLRLGAATQRDLHRHRLDVEGFGADRNQRGAGTGILATRSAMV